MFSLHLKSVLLIFLLGLLLPYNLLGANINPQLSVAQGKLVSLNERPPQIKKPKLKSRFAKSPKPKIRKPVGFGNGILIWLAVGFIAIGIFGIADYFGDQFFENWGLWIGLGALLIGAGLALWAFS